MPHAVPLSQSGRLALERVEIHRHSERYPDLICSGISPPDGASAVVYLVGDAARLETAGYTRMEGGRNQELLQSLKEKREEREGGSEGGDRGRRERQRGKRSSCSKETQIIKSPTKYKFKDQHFITAVDAT